MPNTPLGVTYPAGTDPLYLAATHMQTLATSVDGLLALGVLGVATATGDSATTTTEIRDAATATVTFTAVAGRTYTVAATGQVIMSDVSGDGARVHIRDGGASTPTTTSVSLVAGISKVPAASSGGKSSVGGIEASLTCPGDISAGVHTLGLFINRFTGTGNMSLSAPTGGKRQLKVTDDGSAV